MDNELEQMSPNQRRALDAGLAALDTMAASWAAEVGLHEIATKFAAIDDPDERATWIAAMIRQGFSEGAYRHYIDHKDAIAATETNLARVAELTTALRGLSAMYTRAWDVVGGGLLMLAPCVPLFDAAHKEARRVLGVEILEVDDTSEMYPEHEESSRLRARIAELEAQTSDMEMLRAEVARLNAIINSPQSGDFLRAVSTEAEHQRQRWGSEHDAGKTNADWNALVGYLLAKALIAMATGDRKKSEHHVITAAAALKNWHASVTGQDNAMRPGYADGGHPGLEQGEPA